MKLYYLLFLIFVTNAGCHASKKVTVDIFGEVDRLTSILYNDSIISYPRVNARIESGTFIITSLSDYKLPDIYKSLMREKSDSLEVVLNSLEKDSMYYELSPEQRDSVNMGIDYWEVKIRGKKVVSTNVICIQK